MHRGSPQGRHNALPIKIVPFQPTGETVNVKVASYFRGPAVCALPGLAAPIRPKANSPRYITFNAPPVLRREVSNGEFNIGFNPFTHRIMVMNAGPVWRLLRLKFSAPSKPECLKHCGKTSLRQRQTFLLSILSSDRPENRPHFVSNNTTARLSSTPTLIMTVDPGGLTPLGWTETCSRRTKRLALITKP
jgi:hypothetical protein